MFICSTQADLAFENEFTPVHLSPSGDYLLVSRILATTSNVNYAGAVDVWKRNSKSGLFVKQQPTLTAVAPTFFDLWGNTLAIGQGWRNELRIAVGNPLAGHQRECLRFFFQFHDDRIEL
jgi:hypothetical protein